MEKLGPRLKTKKTRSPEMGLRVLSFTFIAVLIVIPMLVIVQDAFREGFDEFWHQVTAPIAASAIILTLWTSALMTAINALMGLMTAFVLVRYEFPGKRIFNAIIDLPLAIPTLVTGVMLVILYGPQQTLGAFLKEGLGFEIIFAPPGIVLALLFITFPFVVRTIQPVLLELDQAQEHAAATLGARGWTIFRRVIFPALALPTLSGSLLGFARAVGEFGAVVIVAGNIPFKSQTAAVYVLGAVESENRLAASAISVVLIAISLAVILVTNRVLARRPES
ncbi:MAG TPA: sulfate ABC transporter permease subunit CysT [Anaerolineales bacterium]|nr:sulfate ABC transporter permease subunit CysT [Anaerolineales bacterium]